MKAVSEITSLALYSAITVSAISLVLSVGLPALEDQREAASISAARDFMQDLDSAASTVVSQGQGSTRILDLNFQRGRYEFRSQDDLAQYRLRSDAPVISPQSSKRVGNTVLASNARVEVYEAEVNGEEVYVMENSRVNVSIKDIGNSSSQKQINVSDLLVEYKLKTESGTVQAQPELNLSINNKPGSSRGNGYVSTPYESLPRRFLGSGAVTATIDTQLTTYDVLFRLPTSADFLRVSVRNFR